MIKKDTSGLLPADQVQLQSPNTLIECLNTTHQVINSAGGNYD